MAEEQTIISDLIGNTRQEGELYCDYRCRLYWENLIRKRYLQGRLAGQMIWHSANMVKSETGEWFKQAVQGTKIGSFAK